MYMGSKEIRRFEQIHNFWRNQSTRFGNIENQIENLEGKIHLGTANKYSNFTIAMVAEKTYCADFL